MDTNIVDVEKSLKIIQANIRRKIFTKKKSSRSKGSSSGSKGSSKSVFLNDMIEDDKNFKTANKISNFLKSKLIVNKYTLDNRVYFLNYIKNNLKHVKDDDCLEKKQFKDSKGYTIRNIINLEKRISKSILDGCIPSFNGQ